MSLKEQIQEMAEKYLPDPSLFVVDVQITGSKKKRVSIVIDGDQGVNISHCATISRKVGLEMDDKNIIEEAYELDVCSAGVGEPLLLPRQYVANKNRKLSLVLADGTKEEGKLMEVAPDSILVETERKEKKNIITEQKNIPFAAIKEATVMVSFK